jgi:hypothetical protein
MQGGLATMEALQWYSNGIRRETHGEAAMRMRLAAAALALMAAACGRSTEPVEPGAVILQVQAGDTVRLQYGESALLGDNVRIRFSAVESDSRCAINVVCVWAGDAQVRLDGSLSGRGWQPLVVHTGVDPREAEFGGFVIRLIEVAPAPEEPFTIEPSDYSVRLAISRG